jgi:hypothetical protein
MKKVGLTPCIFVILCSLTYLRAQTSEGRISGRVTDQTGAVVPRARVVVTNAGTGAERILTTTEAGDYVAPNLPAGTYDISVEAPSFKTSKRSGIRLEVASNLGVDCQLKLGAPTELVEVSGETPVVDTVTDTLGGTLTNKLINELPLQGRDFQNLLELRPGVQRTPGGGFHSTTTNGLRFEDQNYIVDGVDDNDVYYGETVINNAGIAGTPASHLPLDAIQEFNTQENQSADFGFKPGAVVNIGLKSGTNQFHGTSYYFHRNSAFDARNWFDLAPQPVAALLLHEFGASAGGPIIKNKWFFFANYEGVRDKVGNPFDVSSPVTVSLVGDPRLQDPVNDPATYSIVDAQNACLADAANCGALNGVSSQISGLFLKNPGFTASNIDPSLINFNFNNQNREDNLVVKSDYHIGDKNVITGRYFYANSNQIEEDGAPLRPEWLSTAITHVNVAGVNWTWTPNVRWVNELRFGFNRNWQTNETLDHNRSPQDYGINTGVTDPRLFGFPRISISPFNYAGGNSSWPHLSEPNQTYQVVDNASVTRGSHNIRFGGEFRTGSADDFRAQYGRGRVDFSSLEDFVGGFVHRARILTGDTHRHVTLNAFGGFVQDDWRIRPRVTVNLGLRYDLNLPIKDSHDEIANFIPSQGIVQVGHGISSPYDTQWKNFSPRVGVAWDLRGNGKTVLRAGGSIIFEQPSIRNFIDRAGLNENPSGATFVGLDGSTVQGTGNIQVSTQMVHASGINYTTQGSWFTLTPSVTCSPDNPCDTFGVLKNLATPYVGSWNVNLQQELTKTTALEVAYVATAGIKLYSHRDLNQVVPSLDDGSEQAGRPYTLNCPVSQGGRPGLGNGPCLPWVGFANYVENMGHSTYNGLQITLTQKAYKGLNFLAGYTWAHAIDNGTSNRGAYPQDSNNFAFQRSNGDYDLRHRFTFSMAYELPNYRRAPLQLGQGWTVTSIVNLQSAAPYSITDFNDDISLTGEFEDQWNFVGDPRDFRWSKTTPIPFISPGSFTYDSTDTHVIGGNPQCIAAAGSQAAIDQLGIYGCYVSGNSVLTPPAPGLFGNNKRNTFRGPAYANLDMSVTKRFRLSERFSLQLRGEMFNVMNHANFDSANGTLISDPSSGVGLGLATATPDVAAANPVVGSGGSRHIQVGAKVIW